MREEYINMGTRPVVDTISYKWGVRIIYAMLVVHVFIMTFFGMSEVSPLILANILSIAFYFFMFKVVKFNPSVFLAAFLCEILTQMVVSIVVSGWELGFQLYTFGIVSVVFFCDHAVKRDRFHTIYPLFFSIIAIVLFFLCKNYSSVHTPLYEVDPHLSSVMYTANAVIVLTLMLLFSYVYAMRILSIESSLVENAELDELTGLPNRHNLDRVVGELGLGLKGGVNEYAVAICDIDNFKRVNDRFGHLAGDYVLQKLAEILKRLYDPDVNVARWGGEEFIVVVHCKDAYDTCMMIMEEVRQELENTVMNFEVWQIRVTISIGVADTTEGMQFIDLTDEADKCLYHAKGNGKNQVVGKRWLDEYNLSKGI